MPKCSLDECWITSTGHMIEIQRVTHVKHYSNSALDRLVDLGARHFGSRRIDVALSRYVNLKSYFRLLLARLRHKFTRGSRQSELKLWIRRIRR
jgi:hypothetical protein